jgi:hypothetical protein
MDKFNFDHPLSYMENRLQPTLNFKFKNWSKTARNPNNKNLNKKIKV